MAQKSISEISVSEATLSEANSRLYLSWIESGRHDYLEYNDSNTQHLKLITDNFINNHALVDLKVTQLYTSTPLHVFRAFNWREFAKAEGLMYTNGVVCLYDETTIRLWVQQDTVRAFKYPRVDIPKHLTPP